MTGSLTQLAAVQQRHFDAATCPQARKERGHFGTSSAIADFMATMCGDLPAETVRVLDAGAGVGTLSAALCERVLREGCPRRLEIELWENDASLQDCLESTMSACRSALRAAGHELRYSIRTDDFILEHAQPSLFRTAKKPAFDLLLMNPPYFKLRKDSAHARVMDHVVHGQPNIYALFMAAAADLLLDRGKLVAITPRSYFNGPYFRRFRKWFFDRMTARHIHVFESRQEAFREDEVLQENVILMAEKGGAANEVQVTSSSGRDFESIERTLHPYDQVIENATGDHVVRIATGQVERDIIAAIDRLPRRFRDLPFKISTGPVVTFRATELLRDERANDTAPLLWMHNVRPFVTQFPHKKGKPGHIFVGKSSSKLLVPAKRYVLIKRFTAKEERRRLVAGIVEAEHSYAKMLGLENHLNYVDRIGGELTAEEARGLAALFNSAIVDCYFRSISGNTQVNATEIRAMPFPDLSTLREIGTHVNRLAVMTSPELDKIVGQAIGLPSPIIAQLDESNR